MVGQAAQAGSGPLPVRRTDVGGRHLGSGDSGLASIKNAKGAPLYGPAVYLLQGGDVQRVQLLLQFHPFTHDDLGDYLLCGPGGTALFPVHAADGGRNAGNRLPHGGRSGCRADGRRPERRLCLEWQGVLFPRRPGTAGLFSEASVLYLGWLDRGFGITWDWKPCGRYWFLQNFPSEEMVREQYDYIEQGIPDIIHTSSRDDDSFLRQHGYKPLMPELDGGFWCRVSQGDGEPSPKNKRTAL